MFETPTAAPPPGEADAPLLSPQFLARLETLQWRTRKMFRGKLKGDRLTKKRGQSVEFMDFRDYVPGDDLRHIDWNSLGRLDRLFIRLYQEEEDLCLSILLDRSKSMDFGAPTKFDSARKLAAAMAYIALCRQDRVAVTAFAGGSEQTFGPTRGRHQVMRLFSWLAGLQAGGATELGESCARFARRERKSGIVVLISDFLDRAGFEPALKALQARSRDLTAVQILAQEELAPPLEGDLRLIDSEDGLATEVSVTRPLLEMYRRALHQATEGLSHYGQKRAITVARTRSDLPFEDVIFETLRRAGQVTR